jgi:hypothetical protein
MANVFLGVPQRNFLLAQCCGTLVSVAALLERFYKPQTLMQHRKGRCKPFDPALMTVLKYPLPGIMTNWDFPT